MQYLLIVQKDGFFNEAVDVKKELDVNEYDEVSTYIKRLVDSYRQFMGYRMFQRKLSSVQRFFKQQIQKITDGHELTFAEGQHLTEESNRHLLELLSIFRTFLDQNRRHLSHTFGKDSEQFVKISSLESNLFDRFFSYRFFCKLRNYSQHWDLPVGPIRVVFNKGKDNQLILPFDKASLLKYDGWGPVKKDFKNYDDEFDIIPLLISFEEVIFLFEKHLLDLLEIQKFADNDILGGIKSFYSQNELDFAVLAKYFRTETKGHIEGNIIPFFMRDELFEMLYHKQKNEEQQEQQIYEKS